VYAQLEAFIQQQPQTHTWVIGGHSRGGAIAAQFARQQYAQLDGLVLMGTSHPKDAQSSLADLPLHVAKLFATRDGLASEAEVAQNRQYLPPDAQMIRIEGGNHAQFGWYGFQFGDQTASISREQQHQIIVEALVRFFTQLVQ
jgi:pimeloyl-ACP methyl ester carboxylesterase